MGEAFPSIVVVLQGDGVTADLEGTTFISKAGITSSSFQQVPDVPIGSFELVLPSGPYSALTGTGNLCTSNLQMPTEFDGQNGAVVKQSTKVSVTGCSKVKTLTVKHMKSKKKHKASKKHHKAKKGKKKG